MSHHVSINMSDINSNGHYTNTNGADSHSNERRNSLRTRMRRSSPNPNRSNHLEDIPVSTQHRGPRDLKAAAADAEPLLETETELLPKPRPPIARPETEDDDDTNTVPNTPKDHPGVDDGFFPNAIPDDTVFPNTNIGPRIGSGDDADGITPNGATPRRRSFPYPPGFAPGFVPPSAVDADGNGIPDVNEYQHKKTLAQGMMDLALLSANANQLRYVLESYDRHPYYHFSLVFISISLVLQIAVGVGLIWNSRYNVKNEEQICKADKINNFTVLGIFLITVVNVFIASFGVADAPVQIRT